MKTRFLIPWMLPCLAGSASPALQAPQAESTAAVEQAKTEAEVLFERLLTEYQDVVSKLDSEMRRPAEPDGAGKASTVIDELTDERHAVIAKLARAAKTYAGTEGAVPFLMWRVMTRPGSAVEEKAVSAALATIQEAHIKSVKLKGLLPVLGSLGSRVSAKQAASFTAALEAHSTVHELKAMASYMRLLSELKGATYGTDDYEKLSKDTIVAAQAIGEERLVVEVEKAIEFASKFSLGMMAPDIEGVDLSGVAFKLSDYEGKVVFLDFWGDW